MAAVVGIREPWQLGVLRAGTIGSRLSRARATLRVALGEEGAA